MPTVTEILDRGSKITGLKPTGSERLLALQSLQDAYRRALLDTECSVVFENHSFLTSQDDYTFSVIGIGQPLKLTHVSVNDQAVQQVSFQELLDLRDSYNGAGTPRYYATVGFQGIAFFPNPEVASNARIWYVEDVPELVEATPSTGQESTPTQVPLQFHWSVLLPGMVLEMLMKDQRLAEWQMWESRYEHGIARMQEWIGQFGGEANRAYLGGRR